VESVCAPQTGQRSTLAYQPRYGDLGNSQVASLQVALVEEHARSPIGSFACVRGGSDHDLDDWKLSTALRKRNPLVWDHHTPRNAEFCRVMLRLDGATDDAPLSFLAEPRMLTQWNDGEKGGDKTPNLRIPRFSQSFERLPGVQEFWVVSKNRLDRLILVCAIVPAISKKPVRLEIILKVSIPSAKPPPGGA
jgi:hypothetical protein